MHPPRNLSYCADYVYTHDRDRFLLSLFVPAAAREGLLTLYALNTELAQVQVKISEEMIGHIRFAWWQEAIDGLYAGTPPRGHPVLDALKIVIDNGHLPEATLSFLLEEYRGNFPGQPPDIEGAIEKISMVFICLACPEAETGWRKAHGIIARHRRRFAQGWNSWLSLKLLIAGR